MFLKTAVVGLNNNAIPLTEKQRELSNVYHGTTKVLAPVPFRKYHHEHVLVGATIVRDDA
jgi:hypothetical protein